MDHEATAAAAPASGPGEEGRLPYSPPRLTSYGSLPVDTAAGIGTHTPDCPIGYQS